MKLNILALLTALLLIPQSAQPAFALWGPDKSVGEEGKLKGHKHEIFSLAFSHDGKKLASGSFDGTTRIWDSSTWQVLHELAGHGNWVSAVAFSPDGRFLVSAGIDRRIGARHHGDGVAVAVGEHDRVPGRRPRNALDLQLDAASVQAVQRGAAGIVVTDGADHHHIDALRTRGQRLVRALASGVPAQRAGNDLLAGLWIDVDAGFEIDVDRTQNDDATHDACLPVGVC